MVLNVLGFSRFASSRERHLLDHCVRFPLQRGGGLGVWVSRASVVRWVRKAQRTSPALSNSYQPIIPTGYFPNNPFSDLTGFWVVELFTIPPAACLSILPTWA